VLDVSIDESDIGKVATGQSAAVTFDSIADKTYEGKVTSIAPSATVTSGVATYPAKIALTDPESVKLGMTGNAEIEIASKSDALVVPSKAVKTQGATKVVQVMGSDGQPESRTVTVGLTGDSTVEITDGLAEGDRVVVSSSSTSSSSTQQGQGGVGGMMMGGGGMP
jgi:membrane fusion protein, macrolide-specific efflux system